MRARAATILKPLATALLAAQVMLHAAPARADCAEITFENTRHIACRFDLARDDIRLFWADEKGQPLLSFLALRNMLQKRGLALRFAMNAGMYTPAYKPAGLYVENGRELRPLNLKKGYGNFHLMPNGVFWIGEGRAGVTESRAFARARKRLKVRFATQSGPMLVIRDRLHPRFRAASDSRKIRNGVGVMKDGKTLWFAISRDPVNFHTFARLFRDRLNTPDALFLDGGISQIHAPEIPAAASLFSFTPLGPMVAVVKKAE